MLDVPRGASPIRVEVQKDQPCLWVFVPDTEAPRVSRRFAVVGTGHPAPEGSGYVGSFHLLDGTFVGHLFAELRHDWPYSKEGAAAWAAECEEFGCSYEDPQVGDGTFLRQAVEHLEQRRGGAGG